MKKNTFQSKIYIIYAISLPIKCTNVKFNYQYITCMNGFDIACVLIIDFSIFFVFNFLTFYGYLSIAYAFFFACLPIQDSRPPPTYIHELVCFDVLFYWFKYNGGGRES